MSTALPTEATPAQPADLTELFVTFNRLALQGFGGVLPVAQRELVERKQWLTRHQFVEMLAISQVLMMGDRFFGWRGAVVALTGMLAAPLVIVLVLTVLYGEFARIPVVSGALRGMGAVASGLIISTALKLMTTLKVNPLGLPIGLALAVLTVGGVAWLRLPLVYVVLGLGAVGFTAAYARLAR